ncbi:MAG TPA: gamma carbonic anhydrase family protein [Geobacteraceae bacterium]|nr:gamma carbonic anhydrase family protein [Geobacteraceae bacterium]
MIRRYGEFCPDIHDSAFIAVTAVIIGDVRVGAGSSIWFNTVVRGDVNRIRIGCRTNIQDLCMLHVSGRKNENDSGAPLVIGNDITIGHCVTLHGCTIEDGAFIGMNSVILDGCTICRGSMVAAGSLVPPGTIIPPRTLWMGTPAKFKRNVSQDDTERMVKTSAAYLQLAATYREPALATAAGET